MKLKHWVFLGLAAVGILFVVHIGMNHGGFAGFKSGLGLGKL